MEAAIRVRPFGFDRVFRFPAGEASPRQSGERDEAMAGLRAELERLRAEQADALAGARADGFAAGLEQARGEHEAALLCAVDALHAALDDLDADIAEGQAARSRDAAEVALAAAEMMAGHAVGNAPGRGIDEALGRVLEQVGRGTRITICVHPDMAATMERLIATRAARERRKLALILAPDEAIAPGDARIFWEQGGLVVDAAARRAAVMAELGPLLGLSDNREKDSAPEKLA